jgi:hypothetical protein
MFLIGLHDSEAYDTRDDSILTLHDAVIKLNRMQATIDRLRSLCSDYYAQTLSDAREITRLQAANDQL